MGTDLQNINDDKILQKVESTEVFAEFTPEQKSLESDAGDTKIETNPDAPEYILTVWGIGYEFVE